MPFPFASQSAIAHQSFPRWPVYSLLRPFTTYDGSEHPTSAPGSAMSNGLGSEVSRALVHSRPGITGTAILRGSQYMFIITWISG